MKSDDIEFLNRLKNIKVTLLFTYSGIENRSIEPYPSVHAIESLRLMSAPKKREYKTILYWRPIVPGLNDSIKHIQQARRFSELADATVFTGLFYRDEIASFYQENELPIPYNRSARRKIVPEMLERRILSEFGNSIRLFRKTSCAVSYVHSVPDYNGHYGIKEICDICPKHQVDICAENHKVPTRDRILTAARPLPEAKNLEVIRITDRAAIVAGLEAEQPRYFLQHSLQFQFHDQRLPHLPGRHGRADIGWE